MASQPEQDNTWHGQLNALAEARDAVGLQSFVAMCEGQEKRRGAWHSAKLRFVQQHWRSQPPAALEWVREQTGIGFWKGLTVRASWTLNTNDAYEPLRRAWHEEMLAYNDARGVFKADPQSIEVLTQPPKLSWLIAAMQADKPHAYCALDMYRPGAFAYFEMLRLTGENPMANETFKDWILNNKHPGFSERLDDLAQSDVFGPAP